jgi:hypothetical protein
VISPGKLGWCVINFWRLDFASSLLETGFCVITSVHMSVGGVLDFGWSDWDFSCFVDHRDFRSTRPCWVIVLSQLARMWSESSFSAIRFITSYLTPISLVFLPIKESEIWCLW